MTKLFKRFFDKKVVKVSIGLIAVVALVIFYNFAKSSSMDNISGYAWSADDWSDINGDGAQGAGETMTVPGGAGWISFNCTTGGNCATNNYGVTIDVNDGNKLKGYAWSPHFGWLKFGGFNSGFPIGGGTFPQDAQLVGNSIKGWARFCAGAGIPSACTGTTSNSSNGGWDGWVALSGTNFGVTLDTATGDFGGYAWGGNIDSSGHNTVGTGWINFNTGVGKVVYTPTVAPYVLLHATPDIVSQGATTVLTWEGAGIVTGDNVCTASETVSTDGWVSPPLRSSPTGTFTTNAMNQLGTHTFTITCPKEGVGGTVTSNVNVNVGISLDITATPPQAQYDNGYNVELYWTALPLGTFDGGVCHATSATFPPPQGNGGNVPSTGWVDPISTPPASPPIFVNVPVNPTRFTITCTTASGTVVSDYVDVPRAPIPEAGIVFTNSDVVDNGSGVFTTNLTWSTQNIVSGSCVPETVNPASGTLWDMNNSNQNFGTDQGVIVPNTPPTPKTTYRITCGRIGGGKISSELLLDTTSKASKNVRPHYKEK